MGMARIPVAEFRVHSQNTSLVRATANAPAQPDSDLRQWAQQSSLSSGGMVMGGLALAAVGGIGALLMNVGFFGMVALSSMITVSVNTHMEAIMKKPYFMFAIFSRFSPPV